MSTVAQPPAGTLYVVGTPIGNLGDLSPRARDVLSQVDVIAAEDTRRARGLLSTKRARTELIAYHEHNERELAKRLIEQLAAGASVALISDAGMPLVSDPGMPLVEAAIAHGIAVVSVPGPSAVTAALSISGLPTDRFVFEGFLPRRPGPRRARLAELRGEMRTIVFYEAVHRLGDTLSALQATFGAERRALLAREMTKLHEASYSGSLASLAERLGAAIPLLGEFVLVVAGAAARPAPEVDEVRRVFGVLEQELPPSKAAALTAALTGMPRNEVYKLLKGGADAETP